MNTPDLTSYRLIHRSIRQSTARLTTAVRGVAEEDRHDRGRQLARWYAGFEGELHATTPSRTTSSSPRCSSSCRRCGATSTGSMRSTTTSTS